MGDYSIVKAQLPVLGLGGHNLLRSPIANPDAAGSPFVSSNDAVGNSINGLSPKPDSSDEPLSLMDAYLLYLKRLEASRSQTIDTAADV
jgi:hypothetical protein